MSSRTVEIDTDVGPLLAHADDRVITPILQHGGVWEPDVSAALRSALRPGMVAVDVGANIGYHSLLMAAAVGPTGRVVAVEPDPVNVALLRANAARSAGAPIEIVAAAAWYTTTVVRLARCGENSGDHRVEALVDERELVEVPGVRLDDVLPAQVDLILLDAQASEHAALSGCRALLAASSPRLFVEFWPAGIRAAGDDPVAVLAAYRALGYRLRSLEGLGEDPEELVREAEASESAFVTLDLRPRERGRLRLRRASLAERLPARFPAPEQPWTHDYAAAHRALVGAAADDERTLARFRGRPRLPPGWGVGFDERVVEVPWLLAQGVRGRVLDAGSALNHAHLLDRVLPHVDELTCFTQAPEVPSFPERGVRYVYGDLRALPFADGAFDAVVCVSTLEHVGQDNSTYGGADERGADAAAEADAAAAELARVVRPGGSVFVTVPFGRREDHGWFRQLDAGDLDRLVAAFGAAREGRTVFRYTAAGWQAADEKAAADASYQDHTGGWKPAPDRAAAARAVACVRLER